MKNKKILALVPVLLLLLVYFGGVLFYTGNFLPNTYLNGKDVGGKSPTEIVNELQTAASNTNIVLIKNDETTEEIPLKDIDYQSDYTTDISALQASQTPFKWIFNLFNKEEFTAEVNSSYDEEKLNTAIDSLSCITNETIQDPVDAHIEKTASGFTVVDAIDGNRLDSDKLKTIIKENLNNGVFEINMEDNDCYLKATVKADDPIIQETLSRVEKFNNLVINLDLVDATETIDFNTFKDWILTGDEATEALEKQKANEAANPEKKVLEKDGIVIDREKLYDYVAALSVEYNTFGTTRTFNATGIGEIEVGGSEYDTYGFQLDINQTMNDIGDTILNGESADIAATWKIPAMQRGDNDIGNTYIEVDLTRQYMWYYEDGVLKLETDIKSGLPIPERETPTGAFRVWSKEKGRYLTGEGYRSWVDYWMPFTWTGCGIHDASWTHQFGGTYYKYSGSHGCLNTPADKVAELYDMVKVDTPVIVYKS